MFLLCVVFVELKVQCTSVYIVSIVTLQGKTLDLVQFEQNDAAFRWVHMYIFLYQTTLC